MSTLQPSDLLCGDEGPAPLEGLDAGHSHARLQLHALPVCKQLPVLCLYGGHESEVADRRDCVS